MSIQESRFAQLPLVAVAERESIQKKTFVNVLHGVVGRQLKNVAFYLHGNGYNHLETVTQRTSSMTDEYLLALFKHSPGWIQADLLLDEFPQTSYTNYTLLQTPMAPRAEFLRNEQTNYAVPYSGAKDDVVAQGLVCVPNVKGMFEEAHTWADVVANMQTNITRLMCHPKAYLEFTARGVHYKVEGFAPGAMLKTRSMNGKYTSTSDTARLENILRSLAPPK